MKKQELVKRDSTLPVEFSMEDQALDLQEEEIRPEDLPRPALKIIQKGSPENSRGDELYIEGIREGEIFLTSTRERFDGDKGVLVLPVKYLKRDIEYLPGRKGFVMEHRLDDPVLQQIQVKIDNSEGKEKRIRVLPSGNVVDETALWHCFLINQLDSGSVVWEPVVIPMRSSQLAPSSRWLGYINGLKKIGKSGKTFKPPMFGRTYRLTSVPKKNDKDSWMIWAWELMSKIDRTIPAHEEIYLAAIKYKKIVEAGQIKVNFNHDQQTTKKEEF